MVSFSSSFSVNFIPYFTPPVSLEWQMYWARKFQEFCIAEKLGGETPESTIVESYENSSIWIIGERNLKALCQCIVRSTELIVHLTMDIAEFRFDALAKQNVS